MKQRTRRISSRSLEHRWLQVLDALRAGGTIGPALRWCKLTSAQYTKKIQTDKKWKQQAIEAICNSRLWFLDKNCQEETLYKVEIILGLRREPKPEASSKPELEPMAKKKPAKSAYLTKRSTALNKLLAPITWDSSTSLDFRKDLVYRRRTEVRTVLPFLTATETKLANIWLEKRNTTSYGIRSTSQGNHQRIHH